MGTDENILSLEALQRIYYMVAGKFKICKRKADKTKIIPPNQIKNWRYGHDKDSC